MRNRFHIFLAKNKSLHVFLAKTAAENCHFFGPLVLQWWVHWTTLEGLSTIRLKFMQKAFFSSIK